jgi:hypothetical protein
MIDVAHVVDDRVHEPHAAGVEAGHAGPAQRQVHEAAVRDVGAVDQPGVRATDRGAGAGLLRLDDRDVLALAADRDVRLHHEAGRDRVGAPRQEDRAAARREDGVDRSLDRRRVVGDAVALRAVQLVLDVGEERRHREEPLFDRRHVRGVERRYAVDPGLLRVRHEISELPNSTNTQRAMAIRKRAISDLVMTTGVASFDEERAVCKIV